MLQCLCLPNRWAATGSNPLGTGRAANTTHTQDARPLAVPPGPSEAGSREQHRDRFCADRWDGQAHPATRHRGTERNQAGTLRAASRQRRPWRSRDSRSFRRRWRMSQASRPTRQLRVLSGSEVRSLLGGVSRSTLHRWQAEGKFPARRQVGPRRVGFLEAEVIAFIASLPPAQRRESPNGNSGARRGQP